MSYFCLNLGQTTEDSDMFTIIWLRSRGLTHIMHVHAHAGTRVHEATSLTGLVPERVQLTVHTTEPTGTVPEPFHCDHIARWSARSGTSGRSGTGLNTGNWNGSGTVLVSNLWCEHGLSYLYYNLIICYQLASSR